VRETRRDRSLPVWAHAADALTLVLAATAVYVLATGGYRGRFLGVKVSLLEAWRPALAALVVAIVRHVTARRDPLPVRLWRVALWPWRVALVVARRVARIPVANDIDDFAAGPAAVDRESPSFPPWAGFLSVFLLFWAVTIVMTYPQVSSMMSVRDPGDPYFTVWRLSWIAHQLPLDPWHLFDGNIFHPERFTLAYSDAMLLPGLIGAPFIWVGMHPLLLSNLAVVATFVLSAMAMFHLVRLLTGSAAAGIAAGLLFAFYPFRFDHYAHLELLMTLWLPVAALCLHALLARPSGRRGALLGVAVAAQALSSIYYGVFLLPWLAVLWMTLAVKSGRVRATIPPLVVAAMVAALLIGPALLPYLLNHASAGDRAVSAIQFYSAHVSNYLGSTHASAVYGTALSAFRAPERALFPGVIIVVLAVVGAWPPFSAVRLAYLAALAFAFDASLGLNGLLYPLLHQWVLPFRGLRVPARFAILVGCSLAVLAGYGIARIERIVKRPAARWGLVAAIAVAAMVEDFPGLAFQAAPPRPPQAYDYFNNLAPGTVIAELPTPEAEAVYWKESIYQYYSTFHWMTLVNGNSGYFPPWYRAFARDAHSFPDNRSLAMFRSHGVTYVVIHEDGYGTERFRTVAAAAEGRSDLHEVARSSGLKPGQDVRIYELAR